MLEAVDGFIIVLGTDGHIMYTSESLASLLGYLPSSLHNTTLYEMVADSDKIPLYNTLAGLQASQLGVGWVGGQLAPLGLRGSVDEIAQEVQEAGSHQHPRVGLGLEV